MVCSEVLSGYAACGPLAGSGVSHLLAAGTLRAVLDAGDGEDGRIKLGTTELAEGLVGDTDGSLAEGSDVFVKSDGFEVGGRI